MSTDNVVCSRQIAAVCRNVTTACPSPTCLTPDAAAHHAVQFPLRRQHVRKENHSQTGPKYKVTYAFLYTLFFN